MTGRYCLFGKSEKWLSGIAFFVEKNEKWLAGSAFFWKIRGWWVVPFWKKSKMTGG